MKKMIALFMICATLLYSITICFANEQTALGSIAKDLPLAAKYETKADQDIIYGLEKELQTLMAEQLENLNVLYGIHYLGRASKDSFRGISLMHAVEWQGSYQEKGQLFQSELYKGYYKLRTEKFIRQFRDTGIFDYNALMKDSRQEFDNYIKNALKSNGSKDQLILLLQDKLADKLPELTAAERKTAMNEILALRLPDNYNSSLDYIYQVFESRIRLHSMLQAAEINRQTLLQLAQRISISFAANERGTLLLNGIDTDGKQITTEVLNALGNEEQYGGYTTLFEIYSRKNLNLLFIDKDKTEYNIKLQEALEAVKTDERGYLVIELDELLKGQINDTGKAEFANQTDIDKAIETQIKTMETLYKNKSKEAQAIIKELNRYSIYLDLKSKKLSNSFSMKFESEKKSWQADLSAKLNKFGNGAIGDFALYIKQFAAFEASEAGKTDKGKSLIAKYRNSDIQFKKVNESSLWILDMLYKFQYMK